MSEVEKLLLEIGKGMGRGEGEMRPHIQKLESNWYKTKDQLRGLSDAKWSELGLPGALVDEIKKKLASGGAPAPSDAGRREAASDGGYSD